MTAFQSLYRDGYIKLFCLKCQETTFHEPSIISQSSKETGLVHHKILRYRCLRCMEIHPLNKKVVGQGKRTDLLLNGHSKKLKCPLTTNTTTAKKVKHMEEDEPEALSEEDFDEDIEDDEEDEE